LATLSARLGFLTLQEKLFYREQVELPLYTYFALF
jgi:hypothetical protein